jgi:hypothetical protein
MGVLSRATAIAIGIGLSVVWGEKAAGSAVQLMEDGVSALLKATQ